MLHEFKCPYNGTEREHSDAAKRISDTYRLHRLADPIGSIGHWFACALSDGDSDRTLYDTRRDAVIHQRHNEEYYFFIQVIPGDMNHCQAESALAGVRKLHDAGIRLTDRDHRAGGRVMIPRVTIEDQNAQLNSILYGTRPSNIILPGGNE